MIWASSFLRIYHKQPRCIRGPLISIESREPSAGRVNRVRSCAACTLRMSAVGYTDDEGSEREASTGAGGCDEAACGGGGVEGHEGHLYVWWGARQQRCAAPGGAPRRLACVGSRSCCTDTWTTYSTAAQISNAIFGRISNYQPESWLCRPPNCLYRPGQPQMGFRVSSGINLIQ